MQFTIDPKHITLMGSASACELAGGETKKSVYMLVSAEGTNIRTYEAKKPAQAAIKAYYAFLRSHKQVWTQPLLENPRIAETLRSHLKSIEREHVMHKMESATRAPPGIVRLRKTGENKIRTYLVKYEPDLTPNRHQVDKGIFKTAVAQQWTLPIPTSALQIS
jgi:hypothetical protein